MSGALFDWLNSAEARQVWPERGIGGVAAGT